MPVEVLIWEYRGISHCGHAALKIRHGSQEVYCSWWPSGDKAKKLAKGKDGGLLSPVKARGVLERTYSIDARAECGANGRRRYSAFERGEDRLRPGQMLIGEYDDGTAEVHQLPQHTIDLDGAQDGAAGIGLDLERMVNCWNLLKIFPDRQYRFVSKEYNCASVAGALLLVGGARFYSEMATGKKPDLGSLWTTPNDVRDWAVQIRQGIALARQAQQALRQPAFAGGGGALQPLDGQAEVMDLDVWTRLSCVQASWSTGLARRKDQVARLDEHLRRYHRLGPWRWDNLPQCEQKMTLLGQMLREVCSHLKDKPTSDRRDAVLQLGAQLIARYRHVSGRYSEAFQNTQALEDLGRRVRVAELV
jgi:hypothetical protein